MTESLVHLVQLFVQQYALQILFQCKLTPGDYLAVGAL